VRLSVRSASAAPLIGAVQQLDVVGVGSATAHGRPRYGTGGRAVKRLAADSAGLRLVLAVVRRVWEGGRVAGARPISLCTSRAPGYATAGAHGRIQAEMARKIPKPEQLSERGKHLYDALNGEAPLPCVLVGVAALEKAVASLLQNYFIEGDTSKGLFELGGVLDDFSGCAKVAYCLGLIEKKVFENLNTVGTIRNIFAHSDVPLAFDDPAVKTLCEKLHLPSVLPTTQPDFPTPEEIARIARNRFTYVVSMTWNWILVNALGVRHREKCKPKW